MLRPATPSYSSPSDTSILLYFERPPRSSTSAYVELNVSLYGNRVGSGAWRVRIGET